MFLNKKQKQKMLYFLNQKQKIISKKFFVNLFTKTIIIFISNTIILIDIKICLCSKSLET
jgi:hypothetical protein